MAVALAASVLLPAAVYGYGCYIQMPADPECNLDTQFSGMTCTLSVGYNNYRATTAGHPGKTTFTFDSYGCRYDCPDGSTHYNTPNALLGTNSCN